MEPTQQSIKKVFDSALPNFDGELGIALFFLSVALYAMEEHYKKYGKNKHNDVAYPLIKKAITSIENLFR